MNGNGELKVRARIMALLTEDARESLWAEFMSAASARRESFGALSKQELRAAVDAMDVWFDKAVASFNEAFPLPARKELSTKQRIKLFFYVVKKRWEAN